MFYKFTNLASTISAILTNPLSYVLYIFRQYTIIKGWYFFSSLIIWKQLSLLINKLVVAWATANTKFSLFYVKSMHLSMYAKAFEKSKYQQMVLKNNLRAPNKLSYFLLWNKVVFQVFLNVWNLTSRTPYNFIPRCHPLLYPPTLDWNMNWFIVPSKNHIF